MPSVEPRSQQTRMADAAIIVRILASVLDVDASAWNALLAQQSQPTPFLRHEYLAALQASGSAPPRSGWPPRFVTLWQNAGPGARLITPPPPYLPNHPS